MGMKICCCVRAVSGYEHLFSPAIGEERKRPGFDRHLGKDVVFVGCESKRSV